MKKFTFLILIITMFSGLAIIRCKSAKKTKTKAASVSKQYVSKICVDNGMANNIDFEIKITGGQRSSSTSCYSVGKGKCLDIKGALSQIQFGDEVGPKVETCGCLPNISKWGPDVYYSPDGGTATYVAYGTCFGITSVKLN